MTVKDAIGRITGLQQAIGRPARFMEVCGTHTMCAFRSGLRSLLPKGLTLLSGPGCPVCVTPNEYLDKAIALSQQPGVIVATFGDMIRVPGTRSSLEQSRAAGGNVLVVYSPADALEKARQNPGSRVVFLGIGFETTAPAVAWTMCEAHEKGIRNYSVLCGHKTMPQAMKALVAGSKLAIDGFICPGHVSVITGADVYNFIAQEYHIPCVVTGFEPLDMAEAIGMLQEQVAAHNALVEIQYRRSVNRHGNIQAQEIMARVFEPVDAKWRGLGTIAGSGLRIRNAFAAHDADTLFAGVTVPLSAEHPACSCGEVLQGIKTPPECNLFGNACTPGSPVGACMVSTEGTCAAYYKYAKKPFIAQAAA